ncbi:MAG: hypothetical protein BAJATHORv1_40049 [Candidatus Thorarchaeota archaeon]|nr:MAG: hypothetical protein BAJATHORv1_40049 [Candidatus Thorarchaeota archaeon]
MEIHTTYFEKASREHTDSVIELVRQVLSKNDSIEQIIVATTTGQTGASFCKTFSDHEVIVVTHQQGFAEPNENELEHSYQKEIMENQGQLLTCTHALAGMSRGIRKELGTWDTTEILAVLLRTFGQGTKVCAEIAMMAADAGLVKIDQDVVCVGGTGRGADTAWIIQPANTSSWPKLRMRACVCKPVQF